MQPRQLTKEPWYTHSLLQGIDFLYCNSNVVIICTITDILAFQEEQFCWHYQERGNEFFTTTSDCHFHEEEFTIITMLHAGFQASFLLASHLPAFHLPASVTLGRVTGHLATYVGIVGTHLGCFTRREICYILDTSQLLQRTSCIVVFVTPWNVTHLPSCVTSQVYHNYYST